MSTAKETSTGTHIHPNTNTPAYILKTSEPNHLVAYNEEGGMRVFVFKVSRDGLLCNWFIFFLLV